MMFYMPGAILPGSGWHGMQRLTLNQGALLIEIPKRISRTTLAKLPIAKYKQQIQYLLENNRVLIVLGHTGCGKSTQIPQFIDEAGWLSGSRRLACSQPRRIAATSLAARVADEKGSKVGDAVGYSVRFEDCSSRETRIKYVTDGVLFREILLDPLLNKYGVIMIDEAHERSLYTGKLIYFLIMKKRNDLRVIVSSATLDAEGRGDILAFLTGREEVDHICRAINEKRMMSNEKTLIALPLYAPMDNVRRVIVSTNVAEASVTVPYVSFVIDCGFVKIKAQTGSFQRLITVPISKSSAKQRAGRAVYRLYTEDAYKGLPLYAVPEIQRSDLTQIVISLSLKVLYCLKALDDYGRLTIPFGAQMAELPVSPFVATMLLNSYLFKCTEEILSIAACISVQSVYLDRFDKKEEEQDMKRWFWVEEGDHISLLNVYSAFIANKMSQRWCEKHSLDYRALSRAKTIRTNLQNYLKRFWSVVKNDSIPVRKCILSGFFPHVAQLQPDGSYVTIREKIIHPTSVLYNRSPKYVLFGEMVETDQKWIRDVTVIDDSSWLTEIAAHYYAIK
ncbi:P-loop containing nucleoside triphosphate hydrolase protein [Chytridium lagenaria]|nr:P-loop containing nucleoside triphosphate hydrolase protein [Chytridium lagenaria]